MAPNDAGLPWRALKELREINQRYDDFKSSDSTLLTALIESYKQATHHSASQQILSVIADKLSFTDLHRSPSTAWNRSTNLIVSKVPRTLSKGGSGKSRTFHWFYHKSANYSRPAVWKKKVKLSNGEILDVPNVIRLLIPTRLVNQYFQYCQETGFTNPLPRSTLMKILSESCSASVRRCMQGLNNYLAEGARAFDELSSIVDKLSEIGLGKDVADRLKESLKSGKQYLKGDYKVLSTHQLYLIFNNYFVFKIR